MTKQLKVDNIVDTAGTGKPNFPVSPTSGGAALSTLNTHSYTSSGTEPSSPKNGAIWWDSANSKVYVYANGEFKEITLNTDYPSAYVGAIWYGDRGVFAGGYTASGTYLNTLEYVDITTTGEGTDFGDLTVGRRRVAGCSDATYGVVMGGASSTSTQGINTIDYVTIATTGNATDFGDLNITINGHAGFSDGTYGFSAGGANAGANFNNTIDYITIAVTGNATDFGDLITSSRYNCGVSDATRGVVAIGEDTNARLNTLEYITTATPGNSTDFGDLTVSATNQTGSSDDTRGVFAAGFTGSNTYINNIDYITIQTTGNATDFGDLTLGRSSPGSSSNGTRMVIGGGIYYISADGTYPRTKTIDYITIQTPGNATDFGDFNASLTARYSLTGFSGDAS